ncbi:MAG: hypothetical protein AMJ94_00510 [Deltaproteobacteria bacterium SM23_61]|nr:MAG: hypothetical protein AMJ94_00510 [Deltaproteobacteria bacterium SM23_61]
MILKRFKDEVIALKKWFPATKSFWGILSFIFAWSLFLFPAPPAESGETEILILHTNNVTGYILPCPT